MFPDPKRDYIVLIKKNATLAQNKLKEIEREFETNPLLSARKVTIKEQSANSFSVDVKSDDGKVVNIRIEAYGKGAAIRGLSSYDRRPKIVIVDDPQDIEDATSETVQETDWNWFLSDVMFLGQNTRVFLIGNNLGEKCIVERVFANAKDLGFEIVRIPTMIKNESDEDISTWPAKYTIKEIYEQREAYRRVGKIDIWMREKMCMAVAEEMRVFNKSDYKYYVPAIAPKLPLSTNVWFTIDPASSKEKSACFRAIIVNGVDKNNKWFILDVPYGRWNSDELLDVLFNKVKQWRPLSVGIEKGMFKQVIEPFIYKEMSRRNVFFDIKEIEHAKVGSKLERVKMLAPRFKAHSIWFPERADWLTEMETELAGVTKDGFKSLFTDLIDALAMQEQIAQTPYGMLDVGNLPRYAMQENTTIESINPRLPRTAKMETKI